MEQRIARWAQSKEFIEAREIFGTITFLHLGNFMATADEGDLIVRLSDEDDTQARQLDGAGPWQVGVPGTPVYTLIPAAHVESDEGLHGWLDRALAHVSTLEPKERLVTKTVMRPEWIQE